MSSIHSEPSHTDGSPSRADGSPSRADGSPSRADGSRSNRHASRTRRTLANLWSEWRLEVLVVLAVLLAIFLLVEDMQIRETLIGWLKQAAEGIMTAVDRAIESSVTIARSTTPSNLVGYVLLLACGVAIVARARWRLLHTPRFTERQCPRCGSELSRIHRHAPDRVLHLFVPVRRYRCRNHACQWSGLRVHRPH